MSPFLRLQFAFALVSLLLAWSVDASAASGVVRGRIEFWQEQGNYCPSFRDCTDANYFQSEYKTFQPIAEVQIQVVDASSLATVLGQGTTDTNGNYKISWTSPSTPPSARILWKARHKDLTFEILGSSSGGILYRTSSSFTLTPGTTSVAPQDLPTFRWGRSGAADAITNLYDGAWRMWWYSLRWSNLMQSRFTGAKIKVFGGTSECKTCTYVTTKTIHIGDPEEAFAPQANIMHEMGHLASYFSNYRWATGADEYPCYEGGVPPHPSVTCSDGDKGWRLNRPEWLSLAFEEGLATFFGDVAMYWHGAAVPTTCDSTDFCTMNIEQSYGDYDDCLVDEYRKPITTVRFLWDIYDSRDDVGIGLLDEIQIGYGHIVDVLNSYPVGFGDGQVDEPWADATYTTIDDYDGRSPYDFRNNLAALYGVWAIGPLMSNCFP